MMSAKVIKDKTLPETWKRVVTNEHKYIIMQSSNTNNMTSEVYHSDDCTLNNRDYLFEIKGGIEKVLSAVGHYEFEQKEIRENDKLIDEFLGEEVTK